MCALEKGEVSDEFITQILTGRGVDMTRYNILDGLSQSLTHKPVNHRRVIWLSNTQFRADELVKARAKAQGEAAALVARAAAVKKREEAKEQKVRVECQWWRNLQ